MNRTPRLVLCALAFAMILGPATSRAHAQEAQPAQPQADTQKPATPPADKDKEKEEDEGNIFAPEPAPPMPPGMTGSDANDPRAKLTPGLYDAGETSMGLKHLQLLKKPEAFQLGANDPDDPKVQKMLGQLGLSGNKKIPKAAYLVIAQLAFANS